MKWLITVFLVFCLVSTGCGKSVANADHFSLNDIEFVQYQLPMHSENSPRPLTTSNDNDKKIIVKVLKWINDAEPSQMETASPVQSIPPNFLVVQLKNGSSYTFSPGNNNYVYVLDKDNQRTTRIQSPQLNKWLLSDWEDDLKQGEESN